MTTLGTVPVRSIALLLAIATPALAAPPEPHRLALAAGYKAAFLCSNIFNAGLTEASAGADDLNGIYPEYQPLVGGLEARVDRRAMTVSVAFDPGLPPRIAAWRRNLGCTQLPVGATAAGVALLPRFDTAAPLTAAKPWPLGDAGATTGLPAAVKRRLDALVATAFDHASYGAGSETTAVLVVANGQIVAERYRSGYGPDVPQRTWSVAKSLTASVIGRAVQLGLVKVEAPAAIPEWRRPGDPRAAITLADLMHMTSGLWTDGPGNRTDEVYLGGGAVDALATAMPLEAAPGTRFRYANNDTLLAARAVRAALGDGDRALAFPFTELLWKLGMVHTTPEVDWRGNFILSSQVWTTARDLARLGLLYLNDGRAGVEQLLPPGWAAFVAAPLGVQPPGSGGGGRGYGAFFWRYGGVDGLPADSYAMLGNRGQSVVLVPSRRVIVVRRGFDAAGHAFEDARFTGAVLAALSAVAR